MPDGSAFRTCKDGLLVRVRASAGSSQNQICGFHTVSDGAVSLKVRVRAQPEKGKANKAIVAMLAKAVGMAKSNIDVVAGAGQRDKTILIRGDGADLFNRIAPMLDKIQSGES